MTGYAFVVRAHVGRFLVPFVIGLAVCTSPCSRTEAQVPSRPPSIEQRLVLGTDAGLSGDLDREFVMLRVLVELERRVPDLGTEAAERLLRRHIVERQIARNATELRAALASLREDEAVLL